jgi:hypothetical protein
MLQISLREAMGLLILLMSGTMLLGQNPKPSPSESPKPSPSAKDEKAAEFEPPPPVVTEHSLTLPDGKTLRYKAITGYLLLRDTVAEQNRAQDEQSEDAEPEAAGEPKKNEKPVDPTKGKPKAQVFFVAYVAEDAGDPAARPLTFAFNGGPGSSSIWLHLGGLGPRRVQLSDAGEALPPPAKVVDNESTWLPKTDLVLLIPSAPAIAGRPRAKKRNNFGATKRISKAWAILSVFGPRSMGAGDLRNSLPERVMEQPEPLDLAITWRAAMGFT